MLMIVLEMVFTLLAALGLASVLWVIFARRIVSVSGGKGQFAVVCAAGRGDELEQTIRDLLWLHSRDLYHGSILLVDCGLDEEGRALAHLLCANNREILLCTAEDAVDVMFRKEP